MLRGLLKTGTAWALHWTNSHKLVGAVTGAAGLPMVIGYHRVVEEFPSDPLRAIPAMCISRRMLERQLEWIGRRFRFVTLDELGARMEWGGRFTDPVAAVTFDDAYADVYEHAYPFLKKKGIPAAVFAVTDLVGTRRMQIHDLLYLLLVRAFRKWGSPARILGRFLAKMNVVLAAGQLQQACGRPHAAVELLLEHLPQHELLAVIAALEEEVKLAKSLVREHRSMSWEQLGEMHREGFTIGSHTQTHALLSKEGAQKVCRELAGSRADLEARLNARVKHFAYPCGQFNPETVQAVARAGYRFAYTICRDRDEKFPLLTIPRKLLWEKSSLDARGKFSPAVTSCHVHGAFDVMVRCRLNHAVPAPVANAA